MREKVSIPLCEPGRWRQVRQISRRSARLGDVWSA